MATITGRVLAAMRQAPCVPITDANPGGGPGWYTLELDCERHLLFVGETSDLAARLEWHLARLHVRGAVDPARVWVRWVEARPILGASAGSERARQAIDAVLVSIFQPLWDAGSTRSEAVQSTPL